VVDELDVVLKGLFDRGLLGGYLEPVAGSGRLRSELESEESDVDGRHVIFVYRCPKCGGELEVLTLLTYPPKTKYHCPGCGWIKIVGGEIEYKEIVIDEDDG